MYRYFTHANTRRYLDVLDDLLHSYNNTRHRSIGMAPVEVGPRAWAVPVRTKSGRDVTEAFERVLDERQCNMVPVSYTHLTLPTNREV